jgi:hypothetical protein
MARPRKPESQLSPDSVAHNKGLYAARDREPKAKGELGKPSRWLSKDQKKIWKLLVKDSPSDLGESDRTLLEIAVVLKAELEAGNIENSQITQLIQCLTKLGMVRRLGRPSSQNPTRLPTNGTCSMPPKPKLKTKASG